MEFYTVLKQAGYNPFVQIFVFLYSLEITTHIKVNSQCNRVKTYK